MATNIGYTAIGGSGANLDTSRIEAFSMPEDGTLTSISMHVPLDSRGGGDNIRVGLYSGGTGDADPQNAVLVEDLGILPGAGTTGWRTITSTTTPSLTSGTRYWICIKSNAAYGLQFSYDDSPGDPEDIIAGSTRVGIIASADETVAYEDPVSATGTASNAVMSLYVTYEAAAGAVSEVSRGLSRGLSRGFRRGLI